jgi:hypothetical protein
MRYALTLFVALAVLGLVLGILGMMVDLATDAHLEGELPWGVVMGGVMFWGGILGMIITGTVCALDRFSVWNTKRRAEQQRFAARRRAEQQEFTARWAAVGLGMSQEEILALMGQPKKVVPGPAGDLWGWGLGGGTVTFRDGKVVGYTKPVGT